MGPGPPGPRTSLSIAGAVASLTKAARVWSRAKKAIATLFVVGQGAKRVRSSRRVPPSVFGDVGGPRRSLRRRW